MANTGGRDIIVIGGSSGSIDAVKLLLGELPKDLHASVFIVIHSGVTSPDYLADIFERSTKLRVSYATDREPIELGRVYIAPVDRHLLIKAGEVRVILGPKENGFRPAIDPLLRTAAQSYDGRVIGIILSGLLDDGTQGLRQVKENGGITIAQSPDEAAESSMPRSAISIVGVDHVLRAAEIGRLLNRLSGEPSIAASGPVHNNTDIVEGLVSGLRLMGGEQPPSPLICPDCGGAMWQVDDGELLRFRCHVGHGYTANGLLAQQSAEVEQSLWSAARLLEEQAVLQQRMAGRSRREMRERFLDNARERREIADVIRALLMRRPIQQVPKQDEDAIRKEYTSQE